MLDKATVDAWLKAYVDAWKTYDREAIGNLFSENAVYQYSPFQEPVRGRVAIVDSWLEHPDTPGAYDGQYEAALIEGNRAVARGNSFYFEEDGSTVNDEWSNVFFLRFDDDGRCTEICEWYIKRPK